jgi:predicted ATPase
MGFFLLWPGEWATARECFERAMTFYDSRQYRSYVALYEADLGAWALSEVAEALWCLGYPDQALRKSREALTLAQEITHPYSLGWTLCCIAWLHQYLREPQETQTWAEAGLALSNEHGFPSWLGYGAVMQGWALAMQGQGEAGIAQMREGIAIWRATGAEMARSHHLALLAEAYGKVGQNEEGLRVLAEALDFVYKTGERVYEAELYRLYGELLLSRGEREKGRVGEQISHSSTPPFPYSSPEECFHKAIDVARHQQAKSLELRTVMSLSRLWQRQGKKDEARQMLADIYGWFTEGFDTKDLREAKQLLEELQQ